MGLHYTGVKAGHTQYSLTLRDNGVKLENADRTTRCWISMGLVTQGALDPEMALVTQRALHRWKVLGMRPSHRPSRLLVASPWQRVDVWCPLVAETHCWQSTKAGLGGFAKEVARIKKQTLK